MFMDEAIVFVKAGQGGDGDINFRREKFVPHGGPDGGDGGRGGSVYLQADPSANTLIAFRYQRHHRAGSGGRGGKQNRHGKKGDDIHLKVPVGTVVYELSTADASQAPPRDAPGQVLADLSEPGQEVMVARGGRGGLGNSHFATSTNQAPRIAQKGEPGEERWLRLELKTIADVGVIGYPNVGKSTLLAQISRAQPKIADYPFTTLSPNLGVVELTDQPFVVADIPGLIEGAHRGIGLGHSFLRHVERTRVLIHVVDGTGDDPLAAFDDVNEELELFDPDLMAKPQLVAVNKMDLPDAQERVGEVRRHFVERGYEVFPISAVTGEGVRPLLFRVASVLDEVRRQPAATVVEAPVLRPQPQGPQFTVERESDGFRVRGARVERIVAMTDIENPEAMAMLERILNRTGVTAALAKAGVKPGDTVHFGKVEMNWEGELARE